MVRRFLNRWEALSDRGRILWGIPIAWVVSFVFHQMFPLLNQVERSIYATMEAIPVSLVMAWATKNELRRRAERDASIAKGEKNHDGEH